MPVEATGLLVVALGGNALSPPAGDSSYAVERAIVDRTAEELQGLIESGYRLLIVPGNGPQVGRLMREDVVGDDLDVYVSQTQGELGYLLVQALGRRGVSDCVGLVTRTLVAADDATPLKPSKAVGPLLTTQPDAPNRKVAAGWRLLVSSPLPLAIAELAAIRTLLSDHHVVAGGGGGIPVTYDGQPVQGVVDKDRVAALLAVQLQADGLVFVTDVAGVFSHFGTADQKLERRLSCEQAQLLAGEGSLGEGSMAPKVESAVHYVRSLNKPAHITALGAISGALGNQVGTEIVPSS